MPTAEFDGCTSVTGSTQKMNSQQNSSCTCLYRTKDNNNNIVDMFIDDFTFVYKQTGQFVFEVSDLWNHLRYIPFILQDFTYKESWTKNCHKIVVTLAFFTNVTVLACNNKHLKYDFVSYVE